MEILLPRQSSCDLPHILGALSSSRTLVPFSDIAVDFVTAASKKLLLDAATRPFPELMAIAHWMRRTHTKELEQRFRIRNTTQIHHARGVVVHFAPSNVDSVFLYSWFLSLLMGNSNIVRLSTRRGPQIEHVLRILNQLLNQHEFSKLLNRNLVLTYEHDDVISGALCDRCDLRVLWGGDATVQKLRRLTLPPLATEVAFPDRFSLCALKASVVARLEPERLRELVRQFCNDTFWFDQAGCSSPRMVAWIGGEQDLAQAKSRFWDCLGDHLLLQGTRYPPAVKMNRIETIFCCAALSEVERVRGNITDLPARVELKPGARYFREYHQGGGLFFEVSERSLLDLTSYLAKKDQTLCYFGFEREELCLFVEQVPTRSIDRVVPVGEALNFSHVWDGIDLFEAFSRQITIS